MAGLVLATSGALFLSACGIGGGDGADEAKRGEGLNPGDYTVASAEGLTDSVVVNGNIEPVRSVNITSIVQSEVQKVAVKPGDRVHPEQFLASLDSEQLQRQLDVQQRQQANAQAEAMAAVEQAQSQLNAYQASIDNGTHPGIRAAQSQVNQAQAAYNAAVAGGGYVVSQGVAVVDHMSGHISSMFHGGDGAPAPQAPAPAPAPAPVPAPAPAPAPSAPGGEQVLSPQELAQLTGGTAGAMSKEEAYAALTNAQADLAVARTQAAQERDQLKAAVDTAWRQAENAQLDTGDGTLEYQVKEATVYAPIAGLVTSVDVREGDIPQGKLLTIADDSRLVIRSQVREADVPNISEGDRVTFTSTATGKKEFTGRVARIAPAADTVGGVDAAMPNMGGKSSQGAAEVTFPVEIEVTGDKEGLLLGGSARAEIITSEEKGALKVPIDAVFGDEGDKKVLVLVTDGDDATSGRVEERSVKTGASNDVDTSVTGGDLKAGDIVINWPDEYKDRTGETVKITDPGFDPDAVRQAREKKQPTTATVTVTSTRRAAEGK